MTHSVALTLASWHLQAWAGPMRLSPPSALGLWHPVSWMTEMVWLTVKGALNCRTTGAKAP